MTQPLVKGSLAKLVTNTGMVATGNAWMMFDHDLMRVMGAWTKVGFIDWEAILFNGKHNISPRTWGIYNFKIRLCRPGPIPRDDLFKSDSCINYISTKISESSYRDFDNEIHQWQII